MKSHQDSRRQYHKWTSCEVEHLRRAWADTPNAEIALYLKLPQRTCETKARSLQLHKSPLFLANRCHRIRPGSNSPRGGLVSNRHTAWNKGLKGTWLSETQERARRAAISARMLALWNDGAYRHRMVAAISKARYEWLKSNQNKSRLSDRISEGVKRSWTSPSIRRIVATLQIGASAPSYLPDYLVEIFLIRRQLRELSRLISSSSTETIE